MARTTAASKKPASETLMSEAAGLCESCKHERLIAFSCKGRGFCPSCLGRRMAETAALLVDDVLPEVPVRHWVLSVPFEPRAPLSYDRELMSEAAGLFSACVLRAYRCHGQGVREGGALTVIARTASDLSLRPHLHLLSLDGVYEEREGGTLAFVAHPGLTTTEVAKVLERFIEKLRAVLTKRGYLSADGDTQESLDDEALRDRALVSCATTGAPPAGPMRRVRTLTMPLARSAPRVMSQLCVEHAGFSLHAETRIAGDDVEGREALVKYMLRPPLANHRLTHVPDGLVRIALKKKFADGTVAVEMDPLSLLTRLAAAVPPPRMHTLRYAGVLASRSRFRSRIVRRQRVATGDEKPTPRRRHIPYAELMQRTFRIDVETCTDCGGKMRLIALVKDPSSITRFLRHLGLPTEAPARAPPRDEPYWQSVVLRRRAHEGQLEMFAA